MGEAVAVLRRSLGGADAMGDPIEEWSAETVEGCLVRPLAGSDDRLEDSPDRRRAGYRIAFPKSWTATAEPLAGCRVALVARGMDPSDAPSALRVAGAPDRTSPCPTAWDLAADVWRADG